MTKTRFQVAIDGPVASGKGTVSKLLAKDLKMLYVDTGAMYRMTGLLALRNDVDPSDEDKVVQLVKKADMQLESPEKTKSDGRLITAYLDGEDVSWEIRTEESSQRAAVVAKLQNVRAELVKKQQEIAASQSVIMEGRDITYRVLPDADLKIYLTASQLTRARRRYMQLVNLGDAVTYEQIFQDVVARDEVDMSREHDPLQIVPDAWVLDTSDLSIHKVVDVIKDRINSMRQ